MNISNIADQINPRHAQLALARIMKSVGEVDEWDSETIEWVMEDIMRATPKTMIVEDAEVIDWPSYTSGSIAAMEFWQEVEG
ncbi:hypothetical protein SEA_CULVER_173 [Gordonia phage Culver]|nr:hypothetical protein SEA_CULVER_173 [Gordonia phage Culver]